jgi:4-diphosphocytidyl-2-C-methyl-D-erythritol kinase
MLEVVMNSISMKAYAKINLGLDVLRKREDGYHDVCMIMQTLNLYDTITINRTDTGNISVTTNLSFLPVDQGNLVYRAAALFIKTFSIKDGISIELTKKIPVAAGLAGGSADAAATLRGLNELFETGLSIEELMKLGVTLGADVPYCIMMGTALSEGIGEVLTPLTPIPDCDILLVKPDINVSTKYVYEHLRLQESINHPDITAMRKALEQKDLPLLTKSMDNILQTVTIRNYPIITDIKKKMIDLGALTSLMSGSGPTVFGVYADHGRAKLAYKYFKNHPRYGKQVFLTRPYWP